MQGIENNSIMEQKTPKKRGRKRIKFTEDDLLKIEQASGMGLTNEQLASVLGCSLSTVRRNRKNNELFEHHVRKGRANSLKEVSNALYNNAVYENNVQAQIFFLKNRGEEGQWSEKSENIYNLNLSNVLTEAQGRIIEGERVKEVTNSEQFLERERDNNK
ncbi:MAG TPA: hypothetical protein DCM40_12395 [Maribacter sp.]|mgnify:FL=1|nr:hypothetical protein [Maribacter sp.]